jgi:maltose alpha-D-glucosyltransferase/alpha-amylase
MPGTPVIYYGDEIGMGDNIFLGDRDGVRTPMQWSPDRNGGFSRADPAGLVLPPIQDPVYGFQSVNVEAQTRDAHSLLNWTRRILAVRGEHRAFGRGSLRFLYPANRRGFAYLREHDGETILCIANLSRASQAVELDLSEYAGRTPVELLGNSAFPPIGQLPYLLTLPPYGFYWFTLASDAEAPSWHSAAPQPMPEFTTFVLRGGPEEIVNPAHRSLFENEVVPTWLANRRWFAAKDQKLRSVRVVMAARLGEQRELALLAVEVEHAGGQERYLLPLGIAWDDELSLALPQQLALARVRRGRRTGYLTDGYALPEFHQALLSLLRAGSEVPAGDGNLLFCPAPGLAGVEIDPAAPVRWLSAEQSNSSVIIDHKLVLKLFRRLSAGEHPEAEMGRELTARGFANSAPLHGEILHRAADGAETVLAVLQGYVAGEGDAWEWSLGFLDRAVDDMQREQAEAADVLGQYEMFIQRLGQRLGEMHHILAQPGGAAAFAPETADAAQLRRWHCRILGRVMEALDRLAERRDTLGEADAMLVDRLLPQRTALLAALERLVAAGEGAVLHRVHGDFHLGQVLVASGDAVIIDFEGEPAQPLAERRAKDSPWRDVAGILRSLDYALAARLRAGVASREAFDAMAAAFEARIPAGLLEAYRAAAHPEGETVETSRDDALLQLFLIEKAAYEISYEIGNRPDWLSVPLGGLVRLAEALLGRQVSA